MKFCYLAVLCVVLAGCSSQAASSGAGPQVKSSAQDQIKKIQDDPKMPDGLKQIQIDTLSRQPGAKK